MSLERKLCNCSLKVQCKTLGDVVLRRWFVEIV